VVGLVEVVKPAYPDPADEAWSVVDLAFRAKWDLVSLPLLKSHSAANGTLAGFSLFSQPRLSVHTVSSEHFAFICSLSSVCDGAARDAPVRSRR
jgi:predicted RNA-binding protein with PUA-like domain